MALSLVDNSRRDVLVRRVRWLPLPSWAQRRAGRELGSTSAVADSKQTLLCTYLSAVLLVGLGLNAWLGWSWAEPSAEQPSTCDCGDARRSPQGAHRGT